MAIFEKKFIAVGRLKFRKSCQYIICFATTIVLYSLSTLKLKLCAAIHALLVNSKLHLL